MIFHCSRRNDADDIVIAFICKELKYVKHCNIVITAFALTKIKLKLSGIGVNFSANILAPSITIFEENFKRYNDCRQHMSSYQIASNC